ncbi:hypothetical protein OIE69_05810 [Actinacidiphila glaucinigra]|uniref:hypothetical protein n=1 Tax=Actinacidiphila glaucinigra TaxID=235986 RepID=UPI002DDB43E6|nr:hypothetical protein [Actinacidiphila glaucinigra]WSD58453.1 hypothetical protein OIE69_05810 [Actinacidiphila glaucinigra]
MGSAEERKSPTGLWLLVAVVALVIGVVMVFQTRGALEREREFRAAPRCVSAPLKVSDCRWDQRFTVRSADAHSGKRESPEADLLLPSGEQWHVTFRRTGPVVSQLEPDDKVVGLIWRGQVIEVRNAAGTWQKTSDGPLEWPEDRLGGALAGLSFGLMALAGALWSLFVPGPRHASAARTVRWHGVAMGAAAIVVLWVQAAADWPMWSIPAVWGPLALLLLASAAAFAGAALRGESDGDASPTAGSPRAPEGLPSAGSEPGTVRP